MATLRKPLEIWYLKELYLIMYDEICFTLRFVSVLKNLQFSLYSKLSVTMDLRRYIAELTASCIWAMGVGAGKA